MGGIGGFLIAIWRWIFKALVEERDHYKKLSDQKDQEIDRLKDEVLKLKEKGYQQQILINNLKAPDAKSGASFIGKDDQK
ncbi:hypothetical protein [Lactobacillus crispatus]|uniref:hypothetical protein n=1 Tax=Lactobacillus crispatus TaxID=47770 RepID=UPI001C4E2717|nr:hypothetical protein [Lactobacillus crispatus]MBW0438008.1 hypothetical protein [Lactobacillus crispatus]MBW0444559.1 hypothetical protein [Lactobacillus crispatus]MBW0456230.1 hypothetical protein [Lactobacillus crispatus]